MRRKLRLFTLFFIFIGTLVLSRYFPVVTSVQVFDNHHYSQAEIQELANLKVGSPFLWVGSWRIQSLGNDPWIRETYVYRHWPDTISIRLVERTPFVTDGKHTYAEDGVLLPDVTEKDLNVEGKNVLTRLTGWGANRLTESLTLVQMLELQNLEPQMVSYTPAGFTVQFANSKLHTPSIEALRTHWASYLSQEGTRVHVYPWGVSAVND